MKTSTAWLALCAAAAIAGVAATPALADQAHSNQHGAPVAHGQAVVVHPTPVTGGQGGGKRKSPDVGEITVTKQTDSSSPLLMQHVK